jgi:hemerythrin-like domain-containing protein
LLPIDALMQEHRLIERMISQMQKQLVRMEETKKVNSKFVNVTVDLIRVYADRCHHGKEEGVLFRELNSKPASPEIAKMVMELINEHVYARKTTAKLAQANESYVKGNVDSLKDVFTLMKALVEFYPKHIEKEDNHFFTPSMKCFSPQEQQAMLNAFWDFDRKIIHDHYSKVLDELETSVSK